MDARPWSDLISGNEVRDEDPISVYLFDEHGSVIAKYQDGVCW